MMTPDEWTAHQLGAVHAAEALARLGPQTEYVLGRMGWFMAQVHVRATAAVGAGERSTVALESTLGELRRYVEQAVTTRPWGPPAQAELAAALQFDLTHAVDRLVDAVGDRLHLVGFETLADRLVACTLEPVELLAEELPKVVEIFEAEVRTWVGAQLELRARIRASRQRRRALLAGL